MSGMRTVFMLATLVIPCLAADLMPPAADQQLAREIYKQIIEIKSGYNTGATTPVAEAIAARLKSEGFPDLRHLSSVVQFRERRTFVGSLPRDRNSLASLSSCCLPTLTSSRPSAKHWSMDRSRFNEKDGYSTAVGTADDKAQAAVWVANLSYSVQTLKGFARDRDIIVALTADEEGGGPVQMAFDWLLKNHRRAPFRRGSGPERRAAAARCCMATRISNDVQVA